MGIYAWSRFFSVKLIMIATFPFSFISSKPQFKRLGRKTVKSELFKASRDQFKARESKTRATKLWLMLGFDTDE